MEPSDTPYLGWSEVTKVATNRFVLEHLAFTIHVVLVAGGAIANWEVDMQRHSGFARPVSKRIVTHDCVN